MTREDVIKTSDRHVATRVLARLVVGASFSAVSYAAGFRVELSRGGANQLGEVPRISWLGLLSEWRVGDSADWQRALASAPWQPPEGEPDDPMRAYALAWLCGTRVLDATISDESALHLRTDVGKDVWVSGHNDFFDKSWTVTVPADIPHHGGWSVTCADDGALWCRYPAGGI